MPTHASTDEVLVALVTRSSIPAAVDVSPRKLLRWTRRQACVQGDSISRGIRKVVGGE